MRIAAVRTWAVEVQVLPVPDARHELDAEQIGQSKDRCALPLRVGVNRIGPDLRLSELVNLRVDDLDFEHRLLTVRQGKGKKDRQIPLVDEAVKALRNYVRYRNTELILDDETFFLAKNGTSLNVSSVKYLVSKYVKRAGIRKKVSVHTLRHTFGAHKADKQMGIATLQELMRGIRRKRRPSNTSTWPKRTCGRRWPRRRYSPPTFPPPGE